MKSDLNDLKKLTMELMQNGVSEKVKDENESLIQKIYGDENDPVFDEEENSPVKLLPASSEVTVMPETDKYHFAEEIEEEETLSLHDKELELIKKSLERNKGKRKSAARELGISERTLYRKIKQFDL
jgi:DNA-binding NtrC family response regulator